MMNLRDIQIAQNVESALEDVARSLQKAAKDAEGLSGDASEALSKAAAEVTRAAGSLREHAAAVARNVVQKAAMKYRSIRLHLLLPRSLPPRLW